MENCVGCYQTELGSARPPHSKANLLTPDCDEGKYSVYCRAKQGEQTAHAQKTQTPDGFQGKVFKGNIWGEGCSVHNLFLMGGW